VITKTIYGYSEEEDKIMGFLKRQKSGTYSASGSRMIVPGLGILTANIQNGDKVQIKPNQMVGEISPSATPSPTPPVTPTPTQTPTNTPTPSITPTQSPTNTITPTNTVTPTPSITQTPTNTITPTPSITPTKTTTPTVTQTPTNTITPTPSITPTITPTPSITPTKTTTPTVTQTPTNTTTKTPTPTTTPTPTPLPVLVYDLDAANYSAMPTNGSTIAGTGAYTITMTNVNSSMAWNSANGGVFRKSTANTSDMFYGGPNYSSGTQPFTVFMAYKWDGGTGGRLLNANTASPDFLMGLYNTTTVMNIAFNGASFIGPSNTAADTNWHFIWFTWNGSNSTKSYIATNVAPSTTNGTGATNGGFNGLRLFGRFVNTTTSSEPVTGDVGFVKVWNGELTLGQIQAQHALYKTRFGY